MNQSSLKAALWAVLSTDNLTAESHESNKIVIIIVKTPFIHYHHFHYFDYYCFPLFTQQDTFLLRSITKKVTISSKYQECKQAEKQNQLEPSQTWSWMSAELLTPSLSFLHANTTTVTTTMVRSTHSRRRGMGTWKGLFCRADGIKSLPNKLLPNTKVEVKSRNTTPASSLVFTWHLHFLLLSSISRFVTRVTLQRVFPTSLVLQHKFHYAFSLTQSFKGLPDVVPWKPKIFGFNSNLLSVFFLVLSI